MNKKSILLIVFAVVILGAILIVAYFFPFHRSYSPTTESTPPKPASFYYTTIALPTNILPSGFPPGILISSSTVIAKAYREFNQVKPTLTVIQFDTAQDDTAISLFYIKYFAAHKISLMPNASIQTPNYFGFTGLLSNGDMLQFTVTTSTIHQYENTVTITDIHYNG